MGRPFYDLECRLHTAFELPLEYPRVPPGNPLLTLGANVTRAARCAVAAVQAAPPVHRRMRYSLGTRRLDGVLSLLLAWWRTRLGHGTCRPHLSHARTHGPTRGGSRSLGVVGRLGKNTTLLVALAAGIGGAFACSLVFGIVIILRNRRSARATDPAPGLRAPLVGA
jgi:hypothetical protein